MNDDQLLIMYSIGALLTFMIGVVGGTTWSSSAFREWQRQVRIEQQQLRTYIKHLEKVIIDHGMKNNAED